MNIIIMKKEISSGVVHKVPADLKIVLTSFPKAREAWNDITPLARNEFICWIEDAKKTETRTHRIERTCTELMEGKRRPCCWAGCIHR
ncbi:MAG: YdeI/OmpD-associated family protein [Nanoarchaeota archaeon]